MRIDSLRQLALMMLLLGGFVYDGTVTASAQSGPDIEKDSPIGEGVASSDKPLATLRAEATAAQDRLFEAYNLFNQDDDYDFVCDEESQTGTQLKQRACRPRIVNELAARDARRFLEGDDGTTSVRVIERHQDVAMKKLEAAVAEDPSLMQMLVEFYSASKLYQSENERRCKGKLSSCTD